MPRQLSTHQHHITFPRLCYIIPVCYLVHYVVMHNAYMLVLES